MLVIVRIVGVCERGTVGAYLKSHAVWCLKIDHPNLGDVSASGTLSHTQRNGVRMSLFHRIFVLALFALLPGLWGCPDPEPRPVVDIFDPLAFGTYETNFHPEINSELRVDFGDVDISMTVGRQITLTNIGRAVLKISDMEVTEGFLLIPPDDSTTHDVAVGESIHVFVEYTAHTDAPFTGELRVTSNDPENTEWTVGLFANHRFPCLLVRPMSVDFGIVDPGASATADVEVSNCSPNADTTFSLVGFRGDPVFSQVQRDLIEDVVLLPGESRVIPIAFAPIQSGAHTGKMLLISDDFFEPDRVVDLRGYGKDAPCPTAIITGIAPSGTTVRANPNGTLNALPLDNIQLSAADSFDPEQGSLIYEWALVQRPTDSAARIEPSAVDVQTRLWLDLAGEYHVELSVFSERNVRSCQTARLRVLATADQDIHIQLVWDTPNDPNQLDSQGSDVDLHLLHANGTWDQTPWDCFWRNLSPDWGAPRATLPDGRQVGYDDDPSLDIDDVNGWGPENINLDNPEPVTYQVGVHYFSDHGYGASFATVRVYIGGVLFREMPRQRIVDQDFWHVAQIQWPGGQVVPVNTVSRGFPE